MGAKIRAKKVHIAVVGVQIVIYYKIRKIDTVTNKKIHLKIMIYIGMVCA